ncbi:lipid II flippase MurJ [Chitinivibrio alkaliphilus]|uniref:Integral membrane protein MviN n=1 Tax=Chitinivibrio alkaliphilus ACht1 TaxID=1313304 RepID=U7D4R9_9BACT|nr:lipid II flippase MurJ [Chitinivibrio alkaliphilus]ERP31509.1 integral membrane protein MviN [Chitinivibrio alkaliphilus ACht1]
MVKNILGTSFFQLLSIVLKFLFGVFMAYTFGASDEMDSYVVSITIITLIYTLLTNIQPKALIPYIQGIGTKEKKSAVSAIISFNIKGFMIISLVVWLCSPFLIRIFAPGLASSPSYLASQLLRISSVYLFISSFVALGNALIEMNLRAPFAARIRLYQTTLLLLLVLLLSQYIGIFSLPTAHVFSMLLIIPFYFPFLKVGGINYSPLYQQ